MTEVDRLAFTRRMLMIMAAEIVETRSRVERLCEQFETLATEYGVTVDWDESLEGG